MSATVYRMYDREGALLYIGSCRDLAKRIDMHFRYDHTCADPHTLRDRFHALDTEHYGTLPEAKAAEKAAIRSEAPLLNRHYNPSRWRWTGRKWVTA